MKFNLIADGINLVGATIKKLNIKNNIVDVEREAVRSFGLNINEPQYQKVGNGYFSQMVIDFEIEIEQSEGQKCSIEMALEGAFVSDENIKKDEFEQLVTINGAAAIIGIARGKVETISANIFNNGKIVIPFINVVDYYKSLM